MDLVGRVNSLKLIHESDHSASLSGCEIESLARRVDFIGLHVHAAVIHGDPVSTHVEDAVVRAAATPPRCRSRMSPVTEP